MPEVTVVGAGIAGLTAAMRLAEQGFKVTLFEQEDFLGGKLGAHIDRRDDPPPYPHDYHEHSFHMYLNWYHNFWRIADEIGIRDRFKAQPEMNYLKRDQFVKDGRPPQLINVGAADSTLHNIFSGVESPADMLIYGYSLIDLLGSRPPPVGSPANTSVYDFLTSRPYMTDRAVALHGQTLAKAFANPTYLNAAQTYQRFIGYGFRQPSPMTWLLQGNTQQHLFQPLQEHLEKKLKVDIRKLHRLDRIDVEHGKIVNLEISRLKPVRQNDLAIPREHSSETAETLHWPVTGDVILAVPVNALSQLIDVKTFLWAPELGDVRRLPTQPMASLDVYFNKKLKNVPAGITLLLESPYNLTCIDYSQLWRDGGPTNVTFLNLVMSDFSIFAQYDDVRYAPLIKEYLFSELSHYLEFDYVWQGPGENKHDDIDRKRCYLQTNVNEQLFTNQVGTWPYRPEATCRIGNLFLAGDFCKTFIDVVTIEGAVVSGLIAAEALRQKANVGEPIEIIEPDSYPQATMAALKLMGAPYAYAAKAWTMLAGGFGSRVDQMFPNG
jgi:NAD(P)-binding Rossmann-like domain/Flavin containing amine oxidoreductase